MFEWQMDQKVLWSRGLLLARSLRMRNPQEKKAWKINKRSKLASRPRLLSAGVESIHSKLHPLEVYFFLGLYCSPKPQQPALVLD
jgi:hypothetical protein